MNEIEKHNALVPSKREESRALVVRAINSALGEIRQSIGVSRNWLAKHVELLSLNEDDVVSLVMIRTDFDGALPQAVKYLYKGFAVGDVYGAYRCRQSLNEMSDNYRGASLKSILELSLAFPEADCDNESLGEIISNAHEVVSDCCFWVKWVDQSIEILCAIAEKYGCSSIDTALGMIESRRFKKSGILSDDIRDEVEKNRDDHDL